MKNFFKHLFNVYNTQNHKVICILGIRIKIRSKILMLRNRLAETEAQLQRISNSLLKCEKVLTSPKVAWLKELSDERFRSLRFLSGLPISSLEHLANYARVLKYPSVNRDKISSLVENLKTKGVTNELRKPQKLIVSLTSYPARMYDIHLCLYSLLTQDTKPDRLILWLATEQFPNGESDIPKKVLALKQWGLEIRWSPDYRSFKKFIPALQEFPNDIIVTADDDLYYPTNWLSELWSAHCKTEGIVAHRVFEILTHNGEALPYRQWNRNVTPFNSSYQHFSTTGAGTLIPPGSLHPDIVNYEKAKNLCPTEDDIYIWGMAVLQGSKITKVENAYDSGVVINPERELNINDDGTLYSYNSLSNRSNIQLQNLITAYPLIKERLFSR